MLHKINQTGQCRYRHLTNTRNYNFLIPNLKTKHHLNLYFPRTLRRYELPTEIKDTPTVPLQITFASGLNNLYALKNIF